MIKAPWQCSASIKGNMSASSILRCAGSHTLLMFYEAAGSIWRAWLLIAASSAPDFSPVDLSSRNYEINTAQQDRYCPTPTSAAGKEFIRSGDGALRGRFSPCISVSVRRNLLKLQSVSSRRRSWGKKERGSHGGRPWECHSKVDKGR